MFVGGERRALDTCRFGVHVLARRGPKAVCTRCSQLPQGSLYPVLAAPSRQRRCRTALASRVAPRARSPTTQPPSRHQPACTRRALHHSHVAPAPRARTSPPVSTAMSCRLALRLSPKPGALTAHTCRGGKGYGSGWAVGRHGDNQAHCYVRLHPITKPPFKRRACS